MPAADNTIYLANYQVPDFLIESVDLNIDLHADRAVVRAVLMLRRNPAADDQAAPLVLDGEDLQLKAIAIDGQTLAASDYQLQADQLIIVEPPSEFTLTTEVETQPQLNTSLMGLYQSRGNFCTQCEAQGFRRITYFLDRPDVMTRFTTTLSADKTQCPYLLANGNLVGRGELENHRHWAKWQDPSLKPCYLFALVAGDFDLLEDNFVTASGRDVKLQFFVEKDFLDQADYAMGALKRSMRWDEQTYGLEYDLDIYMVVAVSDFNMGAMENKGLNVFNTKYVLAKPQTATDADFVAIEDVIGHEYFHNWTGNRVTCRDWFQLTLKEGLTVFRDQTFSEDMTSTAVARIAEVNVVRVGQFPEDAGPLAHPIRPASYQEINNFYTATVYRKGAEVIRMIRTLITPEVFRQGMDEYFARHDGQAVTTDDFVAAMAAVSGRDFSQFLLWYSQAGTPQLHISSEFDSAAGQLRVKVKQSCPATPESSDKQPFHMPLAIGLVSAQHGDMPVQLQGEAEASSAGCILELTQAEHEFVLVNVGTEAVLSLNRNFSAPVKVFYDYSLEDLALLVAHDTDPVARWDAAMQLYCRVLLSAAQQHERGESMTFDACLVSTMATLCADSHTDKNLLAQLVCMPSVAYVAQQDQQTDIVAILQARVAAKRYLAEQLQAEFATIYDANKASSDYLYSVDEMGRRAWQAAALGYLVASKDPEAAKLAYDQLLAADNMTDSIAALSALNCSDSDYRQQALDYFYQQFSHEPLVVNKWLTLQASSSLEDSLQRVKAVLNHPAYNAKNPNNIYALICAAGANPAVFHAAQGQGYDFIAEQVLLIDAYNPQVAARVLTPLTRWQQFSSSRAQSIKQALGKVAAAEKLSSDVAEMVHKSLV
jgi:aminopeptidase N